MVDVATMVFNDFVWRKYAYIRLLFLVFFYFFSFILSYSPLSSDFTISETFSHLWNQPTVNRAIRYFVASSKYIVTVLAISQWWRWCFLQSGFTLFCVNMRPSPKASVCSCSCLPVHKVKVKTNDPQVPPGNQAIDICTNTHSLKRHLCLHEST